MRWTAPSLAAACGGVLRRASTRPIAAACLDSRSPCRDALFVPIVAQRDGHDYARAAVAGGASAVLAAREDVVRELVAGPDDVTVVEVGDTLAALHALARDARDQQTGPVIAITGSNGKTTTRALAAAALGTTYTPTGCTRGNLNNHLGVPLTLLGEPHDAGAWVIELGMSAPGENALLGSITRPDVAIVTSIALEHLEFMGSIEAIAAAELEITPYIRSGGALVIPDDEPLLAPHVTSQALRGTTLLPVGFGRGALRPFVRIVDVQLVLSPEPRTRAVFEVRGTRRARVDLRPFGLHNARNAASALAVASHLDLDLDAVAAALAAVEPVGDRGRVVHRGATTILADCYNANPGSVEAALRSLAATELPPGATKIAVLGDMLELGPTSPALHAEIGRLAASLGIPHLVAVGPDSEQMAVAAAAGGVEVRWCSVDDAPGITEAVHSMLPPTGEALVLLKGSRGMKLERVLEAWVAPR
jgi:UDP-N-acetylmuramoyl-tripeptide--D-alanyl-D-alanine ligase